ncbi:uncharacterized protein At2g24330-like [Curcuma longa]|uniref:uncharacterized protein At2g24330-like n=1 Tax=Curcuma longa TaxID=136217 RepID=UPI003D9ECE46
MAAEDAVLVALVQQTSGKQRRGFLSRLWRGIFGRGKEDYEKRLQYLSKEEAAVHSRLKRRAQTSRRIVRNLIVLSVLLEVVAVVYAIMTTRYADLSWQMRAIRVLPMFALPVLSSVIYSTLVSFTRILDRKDQKTLEKLRAERKAKLDELKERTNYYATQQLIQKYDLDPAAKAAAATVLASKMGADVGLKVSLGDKLNTNPLVESNDTEPVHASGLRNRKQPHARSNTTGSIATTSWASESDEVGTEQEIEAQTQKVVEHYKGSGSNDGGWAARLAALLVGEDPSQSYALICGNCHMHNGLARKEDFPHITYYCPHCHALNTSGQSAELTRGIPSSTVDENSGENAAKNDFTSSIKNVPDEPLGDHQNEDRATTSPKASS